jgi:hypothetical protein
MKTVKYKWTDLKWIRRALYVAFIFAETILNAQISVENGVKLVNVEDKQRVDVFVNGSLFTSYQYPGNIDKTFLYPVYSPDGSVITRGYPVEPRKGDRVDHPHHMGIWFNHGNVNGLDFWNNSSSIPADKKDLYGHIVHKKTTIITGGRNGILEVVLNWDDNKGNTLLTENPGQLIIFPHLQLWLVR